ncbi:cysteine hydrolase family protein [Paenibacillus shunpengii]|uniref:Cysteine hydrolase family protein n=1 Tax=Paenibacillus shunpengii TaxID=2054424 RepID=A0ABW5STZ0_9BACL|nr:cysteine hydrolase [Paenibacillus sp. PDC88]SDX12005.1 ureidoacrylate peracid hydrolase [Paenibacillus sp. PDC88]
MSEYTEYSLTNVLKEKTALMIIDMQNDFIHEKGVFAQYGYDTSMYSGIVPVISQLVKEARQADITIIWVGMSHNQLNDGQDAWIRRRIGRSHPPSCRTGTWGADFIQELDIRTEDVLVWKHRYNAFVDTELKRVLKGMGVKTLIAAGINTNTCVESTLREAHLIGYHVVLAKDATTCLYLDAYEPSLTNIERHFGFVEASSTITSLWNNVGNVTST